MLTDKDASYQASGGTQQGTDFMFFDDTVIAQRSMRNWIRSEFTITEQAIDGSVLANSLFSPGYGYHMFSAPTGQSLCSMNLPLPSTGMKLRLDCINFSTDANMSVMASTAGGVTGVSLIRGPGSAISTIMMSAGAWLELACFVDGTWSVVANNLSCTVQAAT